MLVVFAMHALSDEPSLLVPYPVLSQSHSCLRARVGHHALITSLHSVSGDDHLLSSALELPVHHNNCVMDG